MNNGENNWGVTYGRIKFLEQILSSHENISNFSREKDILFVVRRIKQNDSLNILCSDEYTFGITMVRRAQREFDGLNVIFVGGAWNGYTPEAKEYCLKSCLGLYNAKEISGGLWKNDYWNYCQRDEEGNKEYYYKST